MELMTAREVCTKLKIHRATLDRWRSGHGFPRPVRIGPRAIRFNVEAIERWLAERAEASA